jgi:hypothetical protein
MAALPIGGSMRGGGLRATDATAPSPNVSPRGNRPTPKLGSSSSASVGMPHPPGREIDGPVALRYRNPMRRGSWNSMSWTPARRYSAGVLSGESLKKLQNRWPRRTLLMANRPPDDEGG